MMHGHVFVTAFGFGKRVVPASSPFEFAVDAAGDLVVTVGDKYKVVPTGQAAADSLNAESDVADAIEGPDDKAWWIDAQKFRVPFPSGWTVVADGGVAPPFFLVGPGEAAVFLQITDHVRTGDELVAAYQTVVDRNAVGPYESVELTYEHEGNKWLQRHAVLTREKLPYAVLTAQAPADAFAMARDLLAEVAKNIVFG